MMVAEYSKRTLGFLVDEVDRIIRVDWERVKAPESVLTANQGLITAVIELEGGGLGVDSWMSSKFSRMLSVRR
jgi:two-component system chemotaxis response regulator CheV